MVCLPGVPHPVRGAASCLVCLSGGASWWKKEILSGGAGLVLDAVEMCSSAFARLLGQWWVQRKTYTRRTLTSLEWGVVALPQKKGVLDWWKKQSFCGGAGLVLGAAVKLLCMVFWACAAVGASCHGGFVAKLLSVHVAICAGGGGGLSVGFSEAANLYDASKNLKYTKKVWLSFPPTGCLISIFSQLFQLMLTVLIMAL